MRLFLTLVVAGFLGFTAAGIADHELPGGTIRGLYNSAYQLQRSVQYSSLRYHVKNAVYRFANDVRQFVNCSNSGLPTWEHDSVPERCEYIIGNLHQRWYEVDRYLYDTYYDYPSVYRDYRQVQRQMQQLPR